MVTRVNALKKRTQVTQVLIAQIWGIRKDYPTNVHRGGKAIPWQRDGIALEKLFSFENSTGRLTEIVKELNEEIKDDLDGGEFEKKLSDIDAELDDAGVKIAQFTSQVATYFGLATPGPLAVALLTIPLQLTFLQVGEVEAKAELALKALQQDAAYVLPVKNSDGSTFMVPWVDPKTGQVRKKADGSELMRPLVQLSDDIEQLRLAILPLMELADSFKKPMVDAKTGKTIMKSRTTVDKDGNEVTYEYPYTGKEHFVEELQEAIRKNTSKNQVEQAVMGVWEGSKTFFAANARWIIGVPSLMLIAWLSYKLIVSKSPIPPVAKVIRRAQLKNFYATCSAEERAMIAIAPNIDQFMAGLKRVNEQQPTTLIICDRLAREYGLMYYARERLIKNVALVPGQTIVQLFSHPDKLDELHALFKWVSATGYPLWISQAERLLINQKFFEWRKLFFAEVPIICTTSKYKEHAYIDNAVFVNLSPSQPVAVVEPVVSSTAVPVV